MKDFEALKEEAKQYIRYDKDKASKIAVITPATSSFRVHSAMTTHLTFCFSS